MDQLEFLSAAISSIGDGVIIAGLARDILYMNGAAETITGWVQTEAAGEMFDTVFKIVNCRTGTVCANSVDRVLALTRTVNLTANSVLIRKDGEQRFISATISPVRTQDNTYGVIAVFRDITRLKRMEETLSREEQKLNAIFDSAPMGMLILTEQFKIVRANQFFINMCGVRSLSEAVGHSPGGLLQCVHHLADEQGCGQSPRCKDCPLRAATQNAVKNGAVTHGVEVELPLCVGGMEYLPWFRMYVVPLKLQSETMVVMIIHDITRYKAMEDSLIKSRDFYLTLFENFPSLIWRTDINKKCNYVNDSWLKFTGRTFEQGLGDGWLESVHPADRGRVITISDEAFAEQKPFEMEYRLRRYDGEYRWVLDFGKPFLDLEGNFSGYIGAVYDSTERKLAAEALRRYEVLSERANDIILFMDEEGSILEANSAASKAYGYTHEELLTKTIHDLCNTCSSDTLQDIYRQQVLPSEKEGAIFGTVHFRKDGTALPVEVSSQGTVIGEKRVIVSIIRDITERKKQEQALQQALEDANAAYHAKSEFLANMSHEIRTPLNGIVGMIDLTLLSGLTTEQQENLMIAKNCADSLLTVINDILDFSKMEVGKMVIEKVEFDVRECIQKIVKAHGIRAEGKGLELTYQLPANLPAVVLGDPYRLQQILNNLIGNAIKFTETGQVSVFVKQQHRGQDTITLNFSVVDTGIGIAPGERERLFQSFSQVDSSHTRKYGGTGLGLAICKQLVELMGGEIWVESEKGRGSTFHFTVSYKMVNSTHCLPVDTPVLKTRRPLRILLAEDNEQSQIVAGLMLKEMGHTYTLARNGVEVLKLLNKGNFDIILMDIQMPEMDGMETALVIREKEKAIGTHIPIIALTAHALVGDRERFLQLGMDNYVAKPLQINDLFKTIEATIAFQENADVYKILDSITSTGSSPVSQQEMNIFVAEIESHMKHLRTIIQDNNLAGVEGVAAAIKKTAAASGMDSIKSLAFRASLAARRGNWSQVISLYKELENDVRNLKKVIGTTEL